MIAVPDRTTPPPVSDFSRLVMPPLRHITLGNGLPLHVIDQASQEVCCLTCVWRGGLAEAPSRTVAQLMLNLLREGTRGHTGEIIADRLEFNGARLMTSVDSHYSVVKLYMLNSKAADVVPLLPELFLEPVFPDTAFNTWQEKLARNFEISAEKVEFQASWAGNRLMMGEDHPLARVMTASDIRALSADDVKQWHARSFIPAVDDAGDSSLSLYLSGCVTPALVKMIDDTLGKMPVVKSVLQPLEIVPFVASPGVKKHIDVQDAMQSAVRMYMPGLLRSHPDYIKLRLLTVALGGYFGSRLMSNIREDKGYTYGIGSYLLGYPEGSILGISSSTDNAFVEPLIDEAVRELDRLSSGDFTDDEMSRLRRYAMSTLASSLDSTFEIMDYHIDSKIAFLPEDYFERQVDETMSLTSDELVRVAREHLSVGDLTVVVAGGK